MNELEALRSRMRKDLDVGTAARVVEWGNPRPMTEALKRIRKELASDTQVQPTEDQLRKAIARFVNTGSVQSFTELKHLCHGTTVPVGESRWRLIDRQKLFDALLAQVSSKPQQSKHFRRCYQGLLAGYFGFDRNLDEPGEAEQHWALLRRFLADRLAPLHAASSSRGQPPDWLTILQEHKNLLTADPCSRYAKALARGDQSELFAVCTGLGIASHSWVWVEAMMAYVRQVCQGTDTAFKGQMQAVLDLVNGTTAVTLPAALSVAATAMVVARYARCTEHPEHAGLRDTCVQWIGNPWVKRTAWDAAVNDEPARLMVNSWLKQRLIKDFFELLAADGAADLRRLNYWLKWEPQITDMWFVLGVDAASNPTPEFVELRKRMAGRDRRLQDSNQGNNAFVMRIGPLVVIEFGLTGNACYVFAAADFRANLDRKLLGIYDLKQRVNVAGRLSHSGANWEGKFDLEIRRILQRTPESRGALPTRAEPSTGPLQPFAPAVPTSPKLPSVAQEDWLRPPAQNTSTPSAEMPNRVWPFARSEPAAPAAQTPSNEEDLQRLQQLFDELGIDWEDNRPKGGAFWALIRDGKSHPRIARMLLQQGFKFSPGKGYWLKGH
jgi:EH_Signature domain